MAIQIPFPLPITGYALNSNMRINLDFLVNQFNSFNTGTATWDNVSIGTGNTLTGTLTFYNSSNTNPITFQAGVTGASATYTWPLLVPSAEPSSLFSTTGGVMKWKQFLGTTNQVSIANNTGDLTFSLPQSIATSSNVTFGKVLLPTGSIANPVLTFTGDPDTGIYSQGANALGFSAGATGVMAVQPTGLFPIQDAAFNCGQSGNSWNIVGAAYLHSGNGSTANPAHAFLSEPGLGWYRYGSHIMGASSNGVDALYIEDTAVQFNVPWSLAASAPAADLTCQITETSGSGAGTLSCYNGSAGINIAMFGTSYVGSRMGQSVAGAGEFVCGGNGVAIGTRSNAPVWLGSHDALALTIDTSQNLIVTNSISSPIFKTTADGTASLPAIRLNATNTGIYTSGGTSILFSIGGIAQASMDSSGGLFATGEVRGTIIRATNTWKISTGASSIVTVQTTGTAFGDYTLTLPTTDGNSGELLTTNGTGVLSWATAGATTALDNLASVAINTSLLPASDNAIDAGSSSKNFRSLYFSTSLKNGSTTLATATEVGYLSGVTSAIQTQLGTKAPTAGPTFTGVVTMPTPFTLGAVSVTATGTELNYSVGVTSAIQTQFGAKANDNNVVHLNTASEVITANKIFGLGSSDATLYQSFYLRNGGGGSSVGVEVNSYTQTAITTAKTIYTLDAGPAWLFIIGSDGSGNQFMDLIMAPNSATAPSVVFSGTGKGSPTGRTYTKSSGDVQLAMTSGTYTTRVLAFDMAVR